MALGVSETKQNMWVKQPSTAETSELWTTADAAWIYLMSKNKNEPFCQCFNISLHKLGHFYHNLFITLCSLEPPFLNQQL